MTSASKKQREVIRHFKTIVVIVVASAALLIASVFARYAFVAGQHDRLERFHVRSLMLVSEASRRLDDLQRSLLDDDADRKATPSLHPEAMASLDAIERALSSLAEIQGAAGEERFRKTLERGDRQFVGIRDAIKRRDRTIEGLTPPVEALGLTLFQLGRLHSIAAETLLRDIARWGRRTSWFLTGAFGLIILLTGFLVLRTFSVLRTDLRRQERMQEELWKHERQLQQASKMEALGTLVGGVAHDFNNLLTVILGQAELLDSELEPDHPNAEDVREITKAGERAASLVSQLLAFSRYEAIDFRVVDLNSLLRDTEPLLRRLLPEDLSLVVSYGSETCEVEVDRVQIEQVLVNLAVNARDAMAQGGKLTVRTHCDRVDEQDPRDAAIPAGHYGRISVEDTGSGMDAEIRARIFDPFFTTKAPGKGTGLGLSMVHGIVKRSKGHILVESTPGSGTRFDLYLPRAESTAEPASFPTEAPAVRGGSGTLLLAEDDEQVRGLTAASLRRAGYQVLEAHGGEDAIRICEEQENPIDLILTDVVMPGLRGPEMVERAKKFHPKARVIYVSGYTDDETFYNAGVSDIPLLPKPFKLSRLLELVARELERVAGS